MISSKIEQPFNLQTFPLLNSEFISVVDRPCLTLEHLSERSGQKINWKCSNCSATWIATLDSRTGRGVGCSNCVPYEKSVVFLYPQIASEIVQNYTNPDKDLCFIAGKSNDKIRLKCSNCSHEWDSTIGSQAKLIGERCPICRKKPLREKLSISCECGNDCFSPIMKPAKTGESVAELVPNLVDELHPYKNGCFDLNNVKTGYHKKIWWKCSEGHEWEALVSNRARLGVGCPKCSRARISNDTRGKPKVSKISKSLESRFPEVAKFWHPTKNKLKASEVGPASEQKFWWLCERGHESLTRPDTKITKTGSFPCRECEPINRATPQPGKSFADVYPDVARFWHPTLNGDLKPTDVTPHANLYVYWICDNEHVTRALINSRASGFTCGECHIGTKSKIEGVFRDAVRDTVLWDVPEGNARLLIPLRKRSNMQVDIAGVDKHGNKVAIEYDGEYYHSSVEKQKMDVEKTLALLNAGYKVVRVREHGLPHVTLSHPSLLQLNHDFSPRKTMCLPENIALTVNVISQWLDS
jgi:hypothetical protein